MIVGPTFFSSPSGDPHWNKVLYLLPMDGSGQSFVDLGPLAADNTITVVDGGGSGTFDQNSANTLWGNATLQMVQPGAGAGDGSQIYLENSTKVLSATSDLCVEFMWQQASWAAASSPLLSWFTCGPLLPGADLLSAMSDPPSGLYFRTTNNGPGETLEIDGYSTNTWRHVAMQYVFADFKVYVYVDGAKVGQYTASLNFATPGFSVSIGDGFGSAPVGPVSYGYSLRLAQARATAANRYGNVSSIAVPTGPWPIG